MPRKANIRIRRGSEQDWISINPILDIGELGYDTTNNVLKVGDGLKIWTELGVQSLYSPIRLDSDGDFINNTSIRSNEIDFTTSGITDIFTVPEGCLFFINSIEFLTTSLDSPNQPPFIKLGNQINDEAYYQETIISSNNLGARHIVEDPQDAAIENTIVRFTVSESSTANIHKGYCIINGILFNKTITPTPTPI